MNFGFIEIILHKTKGNTRVDFFLNENEIGSFKVIFFSEALTETISSAVIFCCSLS